MAVVRSLVLRKALCALCVEMFFVCRGCERGQVYCGEACSKEARRQKCREYNRDYQDGRQGRLNHAKRQQAYLRRKILARASKKVTDHSLVRRLFSDKLAPKQPDRVHSVYRCWFCGRAGVVTPSIR